MGMETFPQDMAPQDLLARRCYTLIRGSGEIASAVAYALHQAGYPVLLHDIATPTTARRRMAFSDAVFDGEAHLLDLTARRCDDLADLPAMLARRPPPHPDTILPLSVAPLHELLAALPWVAVVDARMRKRHRPAPQMRLAPLTVGLGPGFVAGDSVAVAIETGWEDAGLVVTRGATKPVRGDPQPIAGHRRDRYIYSPAAGLFQTPKTVGDWVKAGEVIASVDGYKLAAPLDGVLRGITRDGVPVTAGTKVIEVDPRGWDAVFMGIGERPHRIAEGVLAVFQAVDWAPLIAETEARVPARV